MLLLVGGGLTLAMGLLLLVTTYLYGLVFSLPLMSLGAFWMNAGSRMERGSPPNLLSRLLAVVACLILLAFWRLFIAQFLIELSESLEWGSTPPREQYGDTRVLSALLGAAALSITACLGRRAR